MRYVMTAMILGGALFATGCAPKVLTRNTFVGDRTAKYIMQQTGSLSSGGRNSQSAGLYDYSIEICDLTDSGAETSCQESVLLRNVRVGRIHY